MQACIQHVPSHVNLDTQLQSCVSQVPRGTTHASSAAVESSSTSSDASASPAAWVTVPYQLPTPAPSNDPQARINAAKQLLEGARQAQTVSSLREVFDCLDDRGLLTMAHVLVCLSRLATLRQQQQQLQAAAGGSAIVWQAEGEQVRDLAILVSRCELSRYLLSGPRSSQRFASTFATREMACEQAHWLSYDTH